MDNEHDDIIRILCRTLGISVRILFAERYMHMTNKEKQEYLERYINWVKRFKKGE